MKRSAFFTLILAVGSLPAFVRSEPSQAPGSSGKPTVYVSDFELDVVPAKPGPSATANAAPSSAADRGKKKEETPEGFASHLVDLVSTKLIAALQNAGYSAERLRRGQGRPESGLQIRGVFAEVDKQNHWRRAVIRSGTDAGKLQVLISVSNLAKPEQAMYEIAHLPGNENKPGAVITLSPYVPLEKYEVDKDTSEDLVQKMATHIVSDVSALLNANPAAIPR